MLKIDKKIANCRACPAAVVNFDLIQNYDRWMYFICSEVNSFVIDIIVR